MGAVADRAPDWVATGTPEPLRGDLVELLGADRVLTRALDIVRYASDASPYRVFPKAVVMARETGDVVKLLGYARRTATPLVFRGGGTSLNGQSQTDGILVDVRRHWTGVTIEDGGERVRVKPGTVLGRVNRALAKHGRKLGPDPASTDIATVGGVIANNSGGMRCGTTRDSYRTVRELTFVLASGETIDTGAPGAEGRFAAAAPELARGLEAIRDEIRGDAELSARIGRKFAIKNTTGYRLCAFLDADAPLEIFRRLLVGSEGTLAFIAEAVFETVARPRCTAVSWLHFPTIDAAVAPVRSLVESGATAVELMVAPALMVASYNIPGTPVAWRELPPESAALLVEFGADDDAGLDPQIAIAEEILREHELIRPTAFTRDHEQVEVAWRVREGMHGLVGRLRPPGTALIVEDVCVPPERIGEAAKDLQALLAKHGFVPGVAGHASAGNLHFNLTPEFSQQSERDRYDAFMGDLVDLVVDKYDGSLKAEHGTGVNMAPFVEHEWGAKATGLMWRIKALADPEGVLGPGVVLNRDPGVHLRNLKTTPEIEAAGGATTCVECGFCEPVCPSRDLTTTPRQRIVLRRELARQPAGSPVHEALTEQYEYDGIDTCAADGTCALVCPLGIDTGALIKDFRSARHSARAERLALRAAERWDLLERLARTSLRTPRPLARAGSKALRAVASHELVPEWPRNMPRPAPAKLPVTTREGAAAVYLPACINRIFGLPRGGHGLTVPEALVAVSARAGLPVWIPDKVAGHCCGTPWSSKGYAAGADWMHERVAGAVRGWTEDGALPVVVDATSCSHALDQDVAVRAGVRVIDSIAWARDHLLERLDVAAGRRSSIAVHPSCAARHMGLAAPLADVAAALADEVVVPIASTCCGFAGDRGFLHPELTAAATAPAARELEGRRFDAYVCSNRTCEIGLQQATGAEYVSIVQVLEEATRPA